MIFLRNGLAEITAVALCLLFIDSLAAANILSKNWYYSFGSHSHDERGLSIADGTSDLMK